MDAVQRIWENRFLDSDSIPWRFCGFGRDGSALLFNIEEGGGFFLLVPPGPEDFVVVRGYESGHLPKKSRPK